MVRRGANTYASLERLFQAQGSYHGAMRAFKKATLQDRLLDSGRQSHGCSVMTLHKCKGKEFDAVIIYDGIREGDTLVLRGDSAPFERSRKLLRVAITRARYHVSIVTPKDTRCLLLPS